MTAFVILQFKTTYTNGKAVDWVEIAPSGEGFERTRTWHRVNTLRPPENASENSISHMALAARWAQIAPAYDAWKKGEDIPEDGTPLAAWSGVSPEQAAFIVRMGIRTVEGVRDMGEMAVAKLPWPQARKLPALARDFLDGRGRAEQAVELDAMREKMAAMEELLAERFAGQAPDADQPKRRGRPPKKDEAA